LGPALNPPLHGASVFPVSSKGPLQAPLTTHKGMWRVYSIIGSTRVPIQSLFTTHKGMWRTYSNPVPILVGSTFLVTFKKSNSVLGFLRRNIRISKEKTKEAAYKTAVIYMYTESRDGPATICTVGLNQQLPCSIKWSMI
jgi:hypothetical protein